MASESEQEENTLDVYTGAEIPLSRSYSISSSQETKLVLILGPVDAGKTTLVSRVFDQFHNGPIGHWRFAGSETIVGYESVLRHHRNKKATATPNVDRTPIKLDPDLFHINLKKGDEEIKAALIANLSGELFNNLIQSNETIEDIDYFQRASHISMVLDGSKLTNKANRSSELRNTYLFLERLSKAKHVSSSALVSIIVAKTDIFRKLGGKIDGFTDETIKKIKDEIIAPLKKNGLNILNEPLEVISEPFDMSTGFKEVIDSWMSEVVQQVVLVKKPIKSTRTIDHYKAGKK